MIVIPALHLRDSVCVQPTPGIPPDERVRLGDPMSITRGWTHAGFRRLHIVDLDAESNAGSNSTVIEDIIRDGSMDVQVSGGIRSTEQVQRFFDAGASSVVVGARGFEEPEWLADLAHLFPGTVVVATDVRERRIVTRGWVRTLPLDIFDVVDDINHLPLAGLLITSVVGNGHLSGADLALLEDVADASDLPVITLGGVVTMNDLRALEHRGIAAVVVELALYSGELDARAVVAEFGE